MDYLVQNNQEEITIMITVKCEAENVFEKEIQKIQFEGHKYCQPQILPLGQWLNFVFCHLF